MRGTAELKHHVIGDVDQRGNAALTGTFQTILHPLRRRSLGVEPLDHSAGKATAQIRSFDMHGFDAFARRRHGVELGHVERGTGNGMYVARNTDDRQSVAAVGRELDFKALVVKLGVFSDIHADGGVCRQNPQALVVFVDAEFTSRAQHAETFDAAHLGLLDLEVAGQHGADRGAGHLDTGFNVRSAANNLQKLGSAHIHLANMQVIGIFMINAVDNFGNHHAFKSGRNRRAIFNFKTGHSHGFGQFVARQVGIDDTAQPFFGKQHFSNSSPII